MLFLCTGAVFLSFHGKRPFGAAFDAAATVHAVGIAEKAVPGFLRWRETERTGFRTEAAFHACVGDTDGSRVWTDYLVDLSHRADGTPEVAIEYKPPDESDRCGNDDHEVKDHSPASDCSGTKPEDQSGKQQDHYRYRCVARQEPDRNFSSSVRQERVECPARTECAAAMPSAMTQHADNPDSNIDEHAVRKIRITPSQCQNARKHQRQNAAF